MIEPISRLDAELTSAILSFLGLSRGRKPTLKLLDELVTAYTQRVPWESVSRITRRATVLEHGDADDFLACARWPDEFWLSALEWGSGGTCFESNYAFFALLQELGFSGYLTVNNMEASIGCHAAIVLDIDGARWLADVGLPLYVPLPLDTEQETRRQSVFHGYTVRPNGRNAFQIERDNHPQSYCFTLIDKAIPEVSYRQVLAKDYGPEGLFLDRVIISKLIGDHVYRFNGGERPFMLERFQRGHSDSRALTADITGELSQTFKLNRQLLKRALEVTKVVGP
jgi:arylamine N-acetyltransferase